jgi:hypothetical protein
VVLVVCPCLVIETPVFKFIESLNGMNDANSCYSEQISISEM